MKPSPVSEDGSDPSPGKRLLDYVNFNIDQGFEPFFPDFATLQRMNLVHIGHDLAKWNLEFETRLDASDENMECLNRLFHKYGMQKVPEEQMYS